MTFSTQRRPGALLKEGINSMAVFLRDKLWLGADCEQLPPVVMSYFLTCLKPALGDRLSHQRAA